MWCPNPCLLSRLQERVAGADTFTVDEPHPLARLAAGHAVHHEDVARLLALKPQDDISTFDAKSHARTFPSGGESFRLRLPATLDLDYGEKVVIQDTSELQRTVLKFDVAGGCTCKRKDGQFTKALPCKTCNTHVTAQVRRLDGSQLSLVDAGYVESEASALREVVLALAMSACKERQPGGILRSCVPECMAPCRPTGSNTTTAVSEAEGGFPANHAHAGDRVVMYFICGYAAPDDGVCGMGMTVSWRDSDTRSLLVTFAAGTHTHLAGNCAEALVRRCSAACKLWGRTPLQLSTGAPCRLLKAVLLSHACNALRGVDAGAEQRPAAVWNALCQLAPPLAALYRNFAFFGTHRQCEEAVHDCRERILLRQGVPPVPPSPEGPATSSGRVAWQLVRVALSVVRLQP